MKIIHAMQYDSRTVFRVCHNPDDPEWVHIIGAPFRDGNGFPVIVDGLARLITSEDNVVPGETGELCHNCRYNWEIVEIIFDGDDCFTVDQGGHLVRKGYAEFETEVIRLSKGPSGGKPLAGAVGVTIG